MQNELYRLLTVKNIDNNLEVLEWLDSKSDMSDFVISLLKDRMLLEKDIKVREANKERKVGVNGEMRRYRK